MALFVLMTRLAPASVKDAGTHYALLGPYDFMDVYDAPDIETAQKISLISRSEGAVGAESWPAVPYDAFLKVLEDVHP